MLRNTVLVKLMLGALLVLCAQPAMAVTTGAPAVPAGYGADDGTHLWSPTDSSVIALELFDNSSLTPGSEFGFFFGSTPGTLVPIFNASTTSEAVITLSRGMVQSTPWSAPSAFFDPTPFHSDDPIGFYLQIDTAGGPIILHTLPGLNGGLVDAVATHASDAGGSYVLVFEHEGTTVAMNLVTGVVSHTAGDIGGETGGGGPRPQGEPGAPVPEPEAWFAFLVGLALVLTSTRGDRVRALVSKQS